MLERALQRAEVDPYVRVVQLDLAALAKQANADLVPLRSWARHRLASNNGPIARVTPEVFAELAVTVGMQPRDLAQRLIGFMPRITGASFWLRR